VVVYARLAGRLSWAVCMLTGWLAFGLMTVALSTLQVPAGAALVLAAAAMALGLACLPRAGAEIIEHDAPPRWDLPVRALCALALVLTLTAVAGWLGPQLSGLLAPFPIIATVLAIFTHAQRGTDELLRLQRGLVSGFGAFVLFCFTLAIALPSMGTAAGFALASVVALLTQSAALATVSREPSTAALEATP